MAEREKANWLCDEGLRKKMIQGHWRTVQLT